MLNSDKVGFLLRKKQVVSVLLSVKDAFFRVLFIEDLLRACIIATLFITFTCHRHKRVNHNHPLLSQPVILAFRVEFSEGFLFDVETGNYRSKLRHSGAGHF